MTKKLYDSVPAVLSFSATVRSCEAVAEGWAILLDCTAFFPAEGGQGADRGTLGGATVLDVLADGDEVCHLTDAPLAVGATVEGHLDAARRRRHMQVHTGEHILSGVLHAMYGATNVGFHLGEEEVTLDLDIPLTAAQLAEAEEAANRAIRENRPVYIRYPRPEELLSLDYRSKLDLTEGVRLVEIEGVDLCACCAPHVASTGEVGLLKITSAMNYKGGVRLHIAVGPDALADYRQKQESVHAVSVALSVPESEIATGVDRLLGALAEERSRVAALRADLRRERLERAALANDFILFYPDLDPNGLRSYAEQARSRTDGLVFVASPAEDGAVRYAMASRSRNVREISAALHAALGGRGGGRPELCQGSLPATREEILALLGGL